MRFPTRFLASLFVLLFIATITYADEIPEPVGYVNDFAHVLKPETVKKLNSVLLDLKQKTGVEMAIVTIKKLNDNDIFDYSVELFEKWGIGQKGKDNGILFLVDVGDRKLRIDTGYGMEGILPDSLLGRIRDQYIIPYFKKDDYDKGIINGTMAIISVIEKAYNVKITGAVKPHRVKKKTISLVDIILLLGLLIFVGPYIFPFFVGGVLGGYRSDWDSGLGGGFGGGLGGGFGGFGGGSTGGGGVGGSW